MKLHRLAAAALLLSLTAMKTAQSQPSTINLTNACIVVAGKPRGIEAKAVQMLVEEVEKRTRIRIPVRRSDYKDARPSIVVGTAAQLKGRAGDGARSESGSDRASNKPEGYLLTTSAATMDLPESAVSTVSSQTPKKRVRAYNFHGPQVTIIGTDSRGLLYGIGRLLRTLRMERDHISVPADLRIASKPFHSLRGHQLGYRPKTNSYDGWSVPMWEQYIRDLIVFGANAVELIPPRSDDAADSPHFPLPPMRMMTEMSRLLDSYGMDVWVWYPAMDPDYGDSRTVAAALKEWGDVFRKLPRVDAVFVPGGDPGHTEPKVLMALLEKQAANLHRYHPKARMWVSPQGFTSEWMEQFLEILRTQHPAWLGGIVFGPQVRMPLPELRQRVPSQYPIRDYPDITHSMQCQFPVENWDAAYALTEGREGINPRPLAHAAICRTDQQYTVGSITYSEGCNDDVNKTVWSALEWDPKADIAEVLREYSRYFIDSRFELDFAEGLLALERNWSGSLAANSGIEQTLGRFQEMERSATPQNKLNWRFQQALYRAYYDAYVCRRLRQETDAEHSALAALAETGAIGWQAAIGKAEAAFSLPDQDEIRSRINALAEALFQSIRMQLSVSRYGAISVDRGANLDNLDHPLNNRAWLLRQFIEIRALRDDPARHARIDQIVHWTDPGPGGFYDDLGDPKGRPHLIPERTFEEDPGHMNSVRMGYDEGSMGRIQWARYAETLYDTPLRMAYTGLDPNAEYKIRLVYGPGSPTIKIRMTTDKGLEIHPWLAKPVPNHPLEFDIPKAATASGSLVLTWSREAGKGGNGRGCQLCEVWLMHR